MIFAVSDHRLKQRLSAVFASVICINNLSHLLEYLVLHKLID